MYSREIDEAGAERILALPKWIEEDLLWATDGENTITTASVFAEEQIPLTWYTRYNPRTGIYTSILFWHRTCLRRLDVGKLHRNPPPIRDVVGRIHKHRWTDAARDKLAYEPPEMSLSDSVAETLKKFLVECNIELRSELRNPPSTHIRPLL